MYFVVLVNEFLVLGVLGFDIKDLVVRRSLLDVVDVFFRLCIREFLVVLFCNYNIFL